MRKTVFIVFTFFLLISSVSSSTCDGMNCAVCCVPTDPPVCSTDPNALNCEMKQETNRTQLYSLVGVLLGFLIGTN